MHCIWMGGWNIYVRHDDKGQRILSTYKENGWVAKNPTARSPAGRKWGGSYSGGQSLLYSIFMNMIVCTRIYVEYCSESHSLQVTRKLRGVAYVFRNRVKSASNTDDRTQELDNLGSCCVNVWFRGGCQLWGISKSKGDAALCIVLEIEDILQVQSGGVCIKWWRQMTARLNRIKAYLFKNAATLRVLRNSKNNLQWQKVVVNQRGVIVIKYNAYLANVATIDGIFDTNTDPIDNRLSFLTGIRAQHLSFKTCKVVGAEWTMLLHENVELHITFKTRDSYIFKVFWWQKASKWTDLRDSLQNAIWWVLTIFSWWHIYAEQDFNQEK